VSTSFIDQSLSLASLINSADLETLKLVHFPFDRLDLAVRLAETMPSMSLFDCLHRIYPYEILYRNIRESKKAIERMWKQLDIRTDKNESSKKLMRIDRQDTQATLVYEIHGQLNSITVKFVHMLENRS
jgi:hypothetical protein